MDRFIALTSFTDALTNVHLKSNMDRFIASRKAQTLVVIDDLKSNMDRFIDENSNIFFPEISSFKIQYG